MKITEFLLARLDEDERDAYKLAETDRRPVLSLATTVNHPQRLILECEAKRRIVEFHESWPVLVDQAPTFDDVSVSPGEMTYRASRQIMWATEQEYRRKFGDEPPTAPMLAALALVYADHPDYDEEWRL